jgi:hypothetical protein
MGTAIHNKLAVAYIVDLIGRSLFFHIIVALIQPPSY